MQELDDNALLREYADGGSEKAFSTLVTRHVNKVYSVALRHTGNPHSAEEITQAVFAILARKSSHLGKRVILEGWLYQTARLTALAFMRSEIRRARREQEAYMQSSLNEKESDVWTQIAPLLDTAVARLNETERHAVVMRYFYGKSMKEVGNALGRSEGAARIRVHRAMEKLRQFFAKHGVNSTAGIIAGAISAYSVPAAPTALAKSVTAVALAKGASASGSTLSLIKGALKIMAWTKAKTAIVVGMAAILAVGTTPCVAHLCRKEYARRTGAAPKQFAKTFFEVCATRNWDQIGKFMPLRGGREQKSEAFERLKEYLGGIQVISIGQPFQPTNNPSLWLVPYEAIFPPLDINIRVSNTNSARRYVLSGDCDSKFRPFDGTFIGEWKWTNEPESLAEDDVYARLSPAGVVRTYFDALSKSDWAAMGKLAPESDVERSKRSFAEAKQKGEDPHKLVPTVDVGQAVWSPEESSYFVKCGVTGVADTGQMVLQIDDRNKRLYLLGGL